MHYENIISDGEYPQIIDYETVCSNYVEMDSQNSLRETADVKVARRLRDSLAGTSFLPTRMVLNAEGESIDFSALNVKDQEVPTLFPVPVMLDTDGACFQKQHVVFSKKIMFCIITMTSLIRLTMLMKFLMALHVECMRWAAFRMMRYAAFCNAGKQRFAFS